MINKNQQYYQKNIETMSFEDIKQLQSKRLVAQIQYVWDNVPYYQEKMKEIGISPNDIKGIEDLSKLPFLTKEDLRNNYPYGFLAKPLEECVRIHSTSGTTGKRVIAFYTKKDIDILDECCARAVVAAGGTKSDIVQIAKGYGLFTGGFGLHGGCNKIGCLILPMSTGNTERQIQFMIDLQATVLCATSSYAAHLADTLEEKGLADKTKLRFGIFGAESWTNEMRFAIEQKLGIKAYDIYGLTEISGPGVAFECIEQDGMHINEDHFIAEIIEPKTGEILKDGEMGELVFTCITKEAFPLIRYRTRDLCILTRKKCSCGRTHIKMSKPMGRCDDMLIIKGVNVFPSQIESVLMDYGMPPYYQIIIDRIKNTDVFDINVEMTNDMIEQPDFDQNQFEKQIKKSLKSMLGISVNVNLVEPKSIERSEGKAVRIIDKRNLYKK